jgi:GTP cyclohydrolase II
MLEIPHQLDFIAQTELPTKTVSLSVRAYRNLTTNLEPIAIISKLEELHAQGLSIPVRIHDACFTSEVLGSLKCDCKQQLDYAKNYIQKHGGVLIYLQQEGRGIGLANKIAAYSLQEQGLDTVEANRALHLPDDARDYHDAVAILHDLGISKIELLTNNPRKIQKLEELGIEITKRLPIQVPSSSISHPYLRAKAEQMGHLLDIPEDS